MEEILDDLNVEQTMKPEVSADLITYEKILIEASLSRSTDVLPNADKNHAVIAYSILFDSSTSHINLVVDSFKGDISDADRYVDSLISCLNRGIKFKVLILNTPNINSRGYQKLLEYKSLNDGSVEIKQASTQSLDIIKQHSSKDALRHGEVDNFALFDNNMYRLEIIPHKFMALLSFNDKSFVSKYSTIFNQAFAVGIA